jgi:spore coat protein U-like protein
MSIKKSLYTALTIGTIVTSSANISIASPQNANIAVSSNIAATCTIVANPLPFGTYNVAAGNIANTQFGVTCANGQVYTIKINAPYGQHSGGFPSTAYAMADGAGHFLGYAVSDTALTLASSPSSNWPLAGVTRTSLGTTQNTPVYGLIPAGQSTAPVGNYTDTITVTVTFP